MKINLKYMPRRLTKKDKNLYKREILKSRKLYKKGVYHTRRRVLSFKSKGSRHVITAKRMYHVDKIGATDELAHATGCRKSALAKIINKGKGAYFSSGSRPNQTARSWGVARLASAITSGKSAVIDYHILEKGCSPNSKALRLAKKAKRRPRGSPKKVDV